MIYAILRVIFFVFLQTSSEFTSELVKRGVTVSQYAAQTYDAVWAMAVAMSKSEAFLNKKNVSFAQYTHKRQDLAYYLLGQMKDLHFNGVSVIECTLLHFFESVM